LSTALVISALSASTAVCAPIAWATFVPRSSLWGDAIWRGDPSSGRVAITFDDGPRSPYTDRVLDVLRDANAPATFFVIGKNVERHPDLARRMHEEGHGIGNHTWSHSFAAVMRWSAWWRSEIERTDNLVEELTGVRPRFFRPPMGYKTFCTMRAVREAGQTVVAWSRRPFDGLATTSESVVRRLSKARAGEILLMHDGSPPARPAHDPTPTVEALPRVIEMLRGKGLRIVRLEELVGMGSVGSVAVSI